MNFDLQRMPPIPSGRDAHMAYHRACVEIEKEMKALHQRLVFIASSTHGLAKALDEARKIVVNHPLALLPAQIREVESRIQSCDHFIAIVNVSTKGVSSKTTSVQKLVSAGMRLGEMSPQPSLN